MDKRMENPAVQQLEAVLGNIELPVAVPSHSNCGCLGEVPPVFDAAHYPQGINYNFLQDDVDKVIATYAGETGKFENPELRDIAAAMPELIELLTSHAALGLAGAVD
jgi:hypothetical protein